MRGLSSRPWVVPAAIVLLALAVRIGVVAVDEGYQPRNDPFDYDYHARSIAAGDGYPRAGFLLQGGSTAIRGPGYPFVLGGLYALTGDSVTAGRLTGAALGALAVGLLYLIAGRIWGRRTGLIAAAMAAVFPPLVLLSRELLSESLFIPLMLAAVLAVLHFRRSGGSPWWAALAGVLCGAAILTRNVGAVLLVAVIVGVSMPAMSAVARRLLPAAVVLACTAAVIAPWTARNAVEFGRFIPVTTSTGYTAAGIYNQGSFDDDRAAGAWRNPQIVPEYTALFRTQGIDEATVDATLRRETREFALEHPLYVAESAGWNLLRMMELMGGSVVDAEGEAVYDRGVGSELSWWERAGIALAVLLAVLGVTAMVRSGRREGGPPRIARGPLFMWLIPILIVLAAAPIGGLPRYRLPADPFLLMLAAIGAAWAWDSIAGRRRGIA